MKAVIPVVILSFALIHPAMAQKQRRGGPDRAPEVGSRIPRVSATTPDGKTTVKLDEPTRHTVLIFGSYT